MEVRCPVAFARTGCRWVTATARSTTPTLTNNLIIVNPSTNDPRTAIPFGRKAHALTRKCGQRRMRQAVAREGGYAKRNPRLARERVIGNRTAIPVGRKAQALPRKCGQKRMMQAVAREGGHAKRNPRLARGRAIENRALPSPHTLARRRFRLAGKCPTVPTMRCHRQGQAFPVWRGGQTE